jgi:hypothetical protein
MEHIGEIATHRPIPFGTISLEVLIALVLCSEHCMPGKGAVDYALKHRQDIWNLHNDMQKLVPTKPNDCGFGSVF